jgi:type I restriction enzyme S subunit
LVASTGKVSLGRVDLVEIEQELVADGHISIIRVDNRKYNCQFLTYFLRSILGVFQIERDYTGATNQIELYSSEIENFDIPDFSLDKQAEIVMKIKTQIDAQNVIDQQIEQKQEAISKIIEQALTNS